MKKDIKILDVSGVYIAAVLEYNDIYKSQDWNVYIINENDANLEMVVVVSKGFDEKDKTSTMRKKIDVLPANSFAKVELVQPELFKLNNQFQVSFFLDNTLFDKTYLFSKNTIKEENLKEIKSLGKKGVFAS